MSKGSGGFWDNLFKNPFGGLFDFNGDGKEDIGEQWLGYKIFEEATKEEDEDSPDIAHDDSWRIFCEDGSEYGISPWDYDTEWEYKEALKQAKYGWRETVEDGTDVGVDPEDFETEEEYEEALEEAKYGWRDSAEDGSEYGLDPEDFETEEEYEDALNEAKAPPPCVNMPISISLEFGDTDEKVVKESDYPNKRRYNAASILANRYLFYADEDDEKAEKARCRFILEQGDTVIAANYLTADGEILFSQAVKGHFNLPITLPDEDESSQFSLCDILKKIAKKDVTLAITVWAWCIEQFLPYIDHAPFCRAALTNDIIDSFDSFSAQFQKAFRVFLNENKEFRAKIIRQADELPYSLPELIVGMVQDGFTDAADAMFDDGLYCTHGDWKQVNRLMGEVISAARGDEEELETMEYVEAHFLPKVMDYPDGMIQDEIDGWKDEIDKFKRDVERYSEKYAYSRGNAWRLKVPDGSEYNLDPRDYDSEEEYLAALTEEKYAWRQWCVRDDNSGLDPTQFETEDEYNKALQAYYDEEEKREREEQARRQQLLRDQREKELAAQREKRKQLEAEIMADRTIYTYYGVKLPFSIQPYYFRSEDGGIEIGDAVVVPVGDENREMEGTVVSVGKYARIGVPFPVEKTKAILRKVDLPE